jgi:protein phosphatase 4 regulatory subunit 3
MTKYEAKVQELARSPVCGERFHNLIRRWEMNTEPPPKEMEAGQRYVPLLVQFFLATDVLNSATPAARKWGQGRLLEAEEEDYFNNSDDDDPPKPNVWPPLSPLGSVNTLKRKRGKGFTAAPPLKQPRPPTVVKSRLTQSLVDYDEDDDNEGSGGASSSKISDPVVGRPGLSALSPPRQIDWFSETQGLNDPVPSKSAQNASHSGNHLDNDPPSPRLIRSDSPPRLGEKRRRSDDDDDEDEMLERLVKSKKPSPGMSLSLEKEDSKSASHKSATPGKMKLKLGATSFSMPSASPGGIPPEKAKKDVDSG